MLIGLNGYAGCGKDTAGAMFVQDHGFKRLAFADPMREALLALDPIIPGLMGEHRLSMIVYQYGWDDAKRKYAEVRSLLQRFGTEMGRNCFGENFWVDQTKKIILADHDAGIEHHVITDVRFENEAQMVKDLGGTMVYISRLGVVAVNGHASEHSLNDWPFDVVLLNDNDLDELRDGVDTLVKSLLNDAVAA